MKRTLRRTVAGALGLGVVTALLTSVPAEAFKPYTHNATAQPALASVRVAP